MYICFGCHYSFPKEASSHVHWVRPALNQQTEANMAMQLASFTREDKKLEITRKRDGEKNAREDRKMALLEREMLWRESDGEARKAKDEQG